MDTQEPFPQRPDVAPTDTPPPPPPRRRASKAALIATAFVTAVIAVASAATGVSDGDPGGSPTGMLIEDDFADPESGWVTGRNANRDMAYEGGHYRVRVTAPAFQQYTYSLFGRTGRAALAIDLHAQRAAGTPDGFFGVVCPIDRESEHGYAFMVHPEEGQFMITEHDSDGWRPISVARSSAPLMDGPLSVRAECFGAVNGETWLVMSVDEEIVLSAVDGGTSTFDGVGLAVWSRDAGIEVRFDNVTASRRTLPDPLSQR